jgi:hypothetical protein
MPRGGLIRNTEQAGRARRGGDIGRYTRLRLRAERQRGRVGEHQPAIVLQVSFRRTPPRVLHRSKLRARGQFGSPVSNAARASRLRRRTRRLAGSPTRSVAAIPSVRGRASLCVGPVSRGPLRGSRAVDSPSVRLSAPTKAASNAHPKSGGGVSSARIPRNEMQTKEGLSTPGTYVDFSISGTT